MRFFDFQLSGDVYVRVQKNVDLIRFSSSSGERHLQSVKVPPPPLQPDEKTKRRIDLGPDPGRLQVEILVDEILGVGLPTS